MDLLYKPESWRAALGLNGSNANVSDEPSTNSANRGPSYVDLLQRMKSPTRSENDSEISLPDARNSSSYPGEKRHNARYKCEGTVDFAVEGSEARSTARFTDISLGGCYVEMMMPPPVGTNMDMLLDLYERHFRARGVVRTSYSCLGMGIAFNEISPEDRSCLKDLLLMLSERSDGTVPLPEVRSQSKEYRSGAICLPENIDAAAVLEAIVTRLQEGRSLTREEFETLIHEMRNSREGL
jgi:PilZ domain